MKAHPLLAVLLLGVVLGLTPVAYAFPPDPSWLPGFYDDDDYDDAIIKVTATVGMVDVIPYGAVRPILSLLAFLSRRHEGSPSVMAVSPYQTRAPPSA